MNKVVKMTMSKFGKVGFAIKKASPEILMVTGITGIVLGTVAACKATLKLGDILKESNETITKINEKADEDSDYADKYERKDLALCYAKTGLRLVKNYAPAASILTVSLVSILASNNILRKRNAALIAAYETVNTSFKDYRNKVIDKFGKDIDEQFRFNTKKEKIEEVVTDENGNEKKVKKDVKKYEVNNFSEYAVRFDKRSVYFQGVEDYDRHFLRSQMNFATDKLRIDGYSTLKDVLESLDVYKYAPDHIRKAALVVGWKFEKDNPEGDNQVIFDVYPSYEKNEDGTYDMYYIVDFNVDGSIYDRI